MGELSKLEWRCRRGTKELDLLLIGYLNHQYTHAGLDQQQSFKRLLDLQDPELYELLTGKSLAIDTGIADVVTAIRSRYHG